MLVLALMVPSSCTCFSEAEETVDPAVAAARAAALEEAERVRAEQVCTFSFPSLVNPT